MLEIVTDWVMLYQSVIAVLISWLGVLFIWSRSRSDWARKKFIRQVNFSLNIVEDGNLLLRTLRESQARDVWLNDYAAKRVIAAARRATTDRPFLSIRSRDDLGFMHRAVINAVSEQC